LYLKEALNSFRPDSYLAVAVMTGVAAERILIVSRDVIVASITDDHRKRKLIEASENQTAKRIYEAVNNRIDPIWEQLPVELQESVGAEFGGGFQVVGRTCNDAEHPTGRLLKKKRPTRFSSFFQSMPKTPVR
jgi:hypothetical protein